jgi:hypothetical protein
MCIGHSVIKRRKSMTRRFPEKREQERNPGLPCFHIQNNTGTWNPQCEAFQEFHIKGKLKRSAKVYSAKQDKNTELQENSKGNEEHLLDIQEVEAEKLKNGSSWCMYLLRCNLEAGYFSLNPHLDMWQPSNCQQFCSFVL